MNWIMKGEQPMPFTGEMNREDLDMLRQLIKVNSVKLTSCEKRCYDLLVKIEKEISWDTLFKIKQATFLGEQENKQWENPFFKANQSRCLATTQSTHLTQIN
jgi:ChAPs (Chs5p-Arf1p-binding proteins)